ncbi:conserved Plasmodium protein, unknown function [Plasmodium reichenowi]|uniref:Sporozoite surface protein essential for liver stage development n=1 Tax=Plasmodium reichenowi TaxID=5854 RepID=A0A060S032_PLARE|nr:hypothetical protein PRSY57_1136200 [Plasmodium reichenowi]KYN96716.1 hypothetical protein PRSY57_1136200 [Plasmodium reichenowi]CDO65180.1 conserved Plasmodium protein, unknown function [Plasmodium reichenowi]SOV80305.1 conserved Plasmodium protein, unknown function [Plasmodium reichenowi]
MCSTYSVEPLVYDSYEYVYLKPKKAGTSAVYYPLNISWKYVAKKKSVGCFGSRKKYTLTPEAYYYPYYYYYVYYYPSAARLVRTTKKEKVLKENNNKESEDEKKKDNVGTEKKECDCSEKEKYIPTYVPLTESYYFPTSALYVPYYSVLVP